MGVHKVIFLAECHSRPQHYTYPCFYLKISTIIYLQQVLMMQLMISSWGSPYPASQLCSWPRHCVCPVYSLVSHRRWCSVLTRRRYYRYRWPDPGVRSFCGCEWGRKGLRAYQGGHGINMNIGCKKGNKNVQIFGRILLYRVSQKVVLTDTVISQFWLQNHRW